jgi:hypothetical protein
VTSGPTSATAGSIERVTLQVTSIRTMEEELGTSFDTESGRSDVHGYGAEGTRLQYRGT